ncbi:shikimate kinase [Shewanella maritima]|uniref:shikimate kinase n=1 Tax=Shewanella maritima TaxID=2520507 RepID=UPI003735641B
MQNILIFGNSASGKSTLAKKLSTTHHLAHLDLDTLAWEPSTPPKRTALNKVQPIILAFIRENSTWVIEGCYADLLDIAKPYTTEMIFMNLPIEQCIANAKNRPWEPHKYSSKAAQDKNLTMLIDWISDYPFRNDELSKAAHTKLYEQFSGNKRKVTSNKQ